MRDIVRQHAETFELDRVEPRAGNVKGETGKWKIEVFGYNEGDARVVLFEARRVKRNVARPQAGEFAFRIQDTGAARPELSKTDLTSRNPLQ